MKSILIKITNALYVFPLFVFFIPCNANAVQEYTTIQPEITGKTIEELQYFNDSNNRPAIAFHYSDESTPGGIYYSTNINGLWSSPIAISTPNNNSISLHGVVDLAGNTPMMVISADNNDYSKLFSVDSIQRKLAENPSDPEIAELSNLLADNQRLFYLLNINGGWTQAAPIAGTERAQDVHLVAGSGNNALLVYSIDNDKNPSTVSDRELYVSVYFGNTWSKPLQITNNNNLEFSIKTAFVEGQYFITWISDGDNDLKTRTDNKIYYSSFDLNGSVIDKESPVSNAIYESTYQTIGSANGKATIIWSSNMEGGEQSVFTSTYNGGWSDPILTKLKMSNFLDGYIYGTKYGDVFLFNDKGNISASLYINGKWSTPYYISELSDSSISKLESVYYIDNDSKLWYMASGTRNIESASLASNGYGLYAKRIPFGVDLSIDSISLSPNNKYLGKTSHIKFSVVNSGLLPSTSKSVKIYKNNSLVKQYTLDSLNSSASYEFDYEYTVDSISDNFVVKVDKDDLEINPVNDEKYIKVAVNPDYYIEHIKINSDDTLTAVIVDRKNAGQSPVSVGFYTADQNGEKLIASTKYDPIQGLPINVAIPGLSSSTNVQIVAKVNFDRNLVEDDYTNNTKLLLKKPEADFVVHDVSIDNDNYNIDVQNIGNKAAQYVDLFVTTDPGNLNDKNQNDYSKYYENLSFQDSGHASISIPRLNILGGITNKLYIIVNPYGKYPESNRNNNYKTSLTTSVSVKFDNPTLKIANIKKWCGNIIVTVDNSSADPGILYELKVKDVRKSIVRAINIPYVYPNGSETINIVGLDNGEYSMELVSRDTVSDGKSFAINKAPLCDLIKDNDISLDKIEMLSSAGTADDVVFAVYMDSYGYEVNYRKPLVKEDLKIEVKDGVNLIYENEVSAYLPGKTPSAEMIKFSVPRNLLTTAKHPQIIVKSMVRDDENNPANNIYIYSVDVGEL